MSTSSISPRPFALGSVCEAQVDLTVTSPCTASELLAALGLSKAGARRVFAQGRLTAARPIAATTRLETGEGVRLSFERDETCAPGPGEKVRLIWHDRFVAAVEKPQGLLVHGDGTGADTLTERVWRTLLADARARGEELWQRPQALMRLDVDTSGIVLFSLCRETQPAFDALVASHEGLSKRYLAIVRGKMREGPFLCAAPIGRDRHDARRMRVAAAGKAAETLGVCLASARGVSLVALRLLTGRRHQIRVHMAHLGHPVAGDELYGGGAGPLMLHAASVAFTHPVTGEDVLLMTDWPVRFTRHFAPRDVDWSILSS